jgi:hypothetical protein
VPLAPHLPVVTCERGEGRWLFVHSYALLSRVVLLVIDAERSSSNFQTIKGLEKRCKEGVVSPF